MVSRTGALALMAVLGILLVFFFPAPSGPFSVTNGPATAFRALEAARGLFAAMSAALLVATALRCIVHMESMTQATVRASYDPEFFALRC
jgi:phosphoglycerol transferase MdoB-like AlkP superfamily enzyme